MHKKYLSTILSFNATTVPRVTVLTSTIKDMMGKIIYIENMMMTLLIGDNFSLDLACEFLSSVEPTVAGPAEFIFFRGAKSYRRRISQAYGVHKHYNTVCLFFPVYILHNFLGEFRVNEEHISDLLAISCIKVISLVQYIQY